MTLFFESDPRFPELDDDGVVRQTVSIWHHYPETVILDKVIRNEHHLGKHGPTEGPDDLSPSRALGSSRIPPEGIRVDVQLDTRAQPDLFSIEYNLLGHTPDGFPVQGRFSVMRPPELPSREQHQPVTDPVLKAKILKAREVLGKEYVTDEDLYRLKRLGYFKDLAVDRSRPAYPWALPPPPRK